MRAWYLVRLCVRLSVTMFSATTRDETTKKRYQKVQCYTGLILNVAIFKSTVFESYGMKTK